MKRIKFVVLLLLGIGCGFSAFAGGDLVNNGGGIAEKNFIFAYQRLGHYLNLCLNSELCKLDKSQRSILQKINQGLPAEQKFSNQLQFLSEKSVPGTFMLGGEMKVAKTGSKVGSPIIINIDLIYTKNEMGYFIPVSVSEAVSILVHELGHHYGDYSHTDLDLLGVRVAMMLQHKTYATPLLPWSSLISAMIINPDISDSFPDVLIYVDKDVLDISNEYKKVAFCPEFFIPIPILPIPDINVAKTPPKGSIIHNVRWNKSEGTETQVKLSFSGDLSHKCKDSNNVNFRNQDYRVEVDFVVTKDSKGRWSLHKDSVKLEQKRDPWWKIIRFGN